MPDTRELVLLDQMSAGSRTLVWWAQIASRIKLTLRHLVVATSGTPLRFLYDAIYRLHVWYAVRTLKSFPGTRAVYATRGIASGDVVYGISDIDIVTIGEWPKEEHSRLIAAIRRLIRLSPLYDSTLWQQVHSRTELRTLWETDYFFQSRFSQGRTQWKLLAGVDAISEIPAMPPDRAAGGLYMELKSWWLHFIMSTFGTGPTARDTIFRHSICYKAVTEILNLTSGQSLNRAAALSSALSEADSHTRPFLQRLSASAEGRHLRYDGDLQNDSLQFLLPLLETAHVAIADAPVFRPASAAVHLDAPAAEVLRSRAVDEHVRSIVAHAKSAWPGYQSASLIPSVACFAQDDLLLVLEVSQLPDCRQLQELCRIHAEARPRLLQRVTLYLRLPHGAYQLDLVTTIEMWRVLLCPAANPDVFALLGRQEFVIDGTPANAPVAPVWSVFANDLVNEELGVRRSAMANIDPAAFPSSLEITRNLWRHLQLEIVSRSTQAGHTIIPLTPAAIQRALAAWGLPPAPVFDQLREAYQQELEGIATDVRPLIPQLMMIVGQLQ